MKNNGDRLIWIRASKDEYQLPDYPAPLDTGDKVRQDIAAGRIVAAYALGTFRSC